MSDLLKESAPIARKRHRCDLCHAAINPGKRYRRQTLTEYGHVWDWVECAECVDAKLDALVWLWDGNGVDADVAYEWATDQVIHGAPDEQRAAKDFLERWGTDE